MALPRLSSDLLCFVHQMPRGGGRAGVGAEAAEGCTRSDGGAACLRRRSSCGARCVAGVSGPVICVDFWLSTFAALEPPPPVSARRSMPSSTRCMFMQPRVAATEPVCLRAHNSAMRSRTPRPDWASCHDLFIGGRETWVGIANGKTSEEKLGR